MVMATGAGFLLGKIDIKIMIGVALAVATIFGAPSIYNAITGKDTGNCQD
jgi:type IV secretory pathway VirB2 component (pilin)